MNSRIAENNHAELTGVILSELEFSHEVSGERFFKTRIRSERLSESSDELPVILSEKLLERRQFRAGERVKIAGQFRSYNRHEEKKNKLILSVYAQEMEAISPETTEVAPENNVELDGFICKKPIYRTTPLGREITDVLLAVNRSYGKSDYIPCICWGSNARAVKDLTVGDKLRLSGRIQSRMYQKKESDGSVDNRIAYEVSVGKLETL